MIIEELWCFCITGCVRKVKPSALTLKPPLARGNRFPPLDHRNRVILNLRVLLWHAGMSPLRLQNTHTNTYRLYTQKEISHAYEMGKNTFHTGGRREERRLLQPNSCHPLWCLKVVGWPLVISTKASGSTSFRITETLMTATQTHTRAHKFIN